MDVHIGSIKLELTINFESSCECTQFLHQYLQASDELELLRHDVYRWRVVALALWFFLCRFRFRLTHFHFERRRGCA